VAAVRTSLSIVGAFLPLAGPPLYRSLNYGLGNTVLAIIALAMTPIPMLFYKLVRPSCASACHMRMLNLSTDSAA